MNYNKKYDFSKGERSKFYKEDIVINYPVYLEPDNLKFIKSIAEKNKSDIGKIVNDLIKSNIRHAKVSKNKFLSKFLFSLQPNYPINRSALVVA